LAAYSLGKMSAWEATDALIARLDEETDEAVREEVALALGRLKDADAVTVLLESYEAGEIEREVCLNALLRMEASAAEALISVASRWNVALTSRLLAVEALTALRPPEAVEPLSIILERPHEPDALRAAVADALAALGDPEALPAVEAAAADPNAAPEVHAAARRALTQLRDDALF
jgi:HEAT repeat protein